MNKGDFVRHLNSYRCILVRQGANHEIWTNPENAARASVPRHQSLNRNTVRRICRDLEIPLPLNL
jgi:predicted RNA binding protein YcfA (HicA-like mRNA interferase family)